MAKTYDFNTKKYKIDRRSVATNEDGSYKSSILWTAYETIMELEPMILKDLCAYVKKYVDSLYYSAPNLEKQHIKNIIYQRWDITLLKHDLDYMHKRYLDEVKKNFIKS